MRNFIDMIEGTLTEAFGNDFVTVARQCDTVERFIQKTDGMDALYRGHAGGPVENNSFFTDYVGHAGEYGDIVDAYGYDERDVMFFNDQRFDEMRAAFKKIDNKALAAMYQESLVGNRFAADYINAFPAVLKLLKSSKPYSYFAAHFPDNDKIIPLMQRYALDHGKNIIAFLGGDYGEYGGQNEFVVRDVSQLTDLRKLYAEVHQDTI